MNHGIDSTESTDIRRALDRLQDTLEEFSARMREMRRERRQIQEYVVELEREVERAERNASEHAQVGVAERERGEELLDRIAQSERRQSDLLARIAELEQAVRERESLVAEQEDLIQQYQARFDDAREFGARHDTARRELDQEVRRLREELDLVRASEQEALRRAQDVESRHPAGQPSAEDQIEGMSAQLAQLRQTVEDLEAERAELVANRARLTEAYETVRQSERDALGRLGRVESELGEARERERLASAKLVELEQRNRALQTELDSLTAHLRDIGSDHAELENARKLEEELERSRLALAEREQAAASASRQVDTLREQLGLFEQEVGMLRAERERLAGAVNGTADETGALKIREEERQEMIGQIQSAIGLIDRYLSEA
jgi:chromosome segregation protein